MQIKPFFALFRTRLVLLILLLVVPAFGLIVYSYLEQRRIEKERVREGAMGISQLAAAHEENFIKNTRQLLATISEIHFLVLSTNRPFCETHLFNLRKLLPDYLNFGLIETNGILFCAAEPIESAIYLGDRAYFRRVLETKKFATGNFMVGRVTKQPGLNFGYPVFDERGGLARVFYASLKISRLSEAVKDIPIPTGGTLTILDRNGVVLARYPDAEKWVGKNLTNAPVIQKILAGRERVFEMPGIDHVRRLHAVTVISDNTSASLFVSVGIPVAVSFADANAALVRNLIVLGLVALTILIIARFYARRFVLQPINALDRATKRLAHGDLDARVGLIHGPTELLELGRAFDEMAERSQKRQREIESANERIVELNRDLEQRVEERTAERDRFFNLSRDLLCIAGFDGYFKRLNPAWEHVLGYSHEELLKKPYEDLVHPDDIKTTQAKAGGLARGEEVIHFENRYQHKDGSYRWLSWNARADISRQLIYASARDVTEAKTSQAQIEKLNSELQQRACQLEAANKELEAFSYSVSHDLRAPLRHINGFVDLLKKSSTGMDEKAARYLDFIAGSAQQMGTLIDDLLNFSRMARAEMRLVEVNLSQLVEEVRRDLTAEVGDRAVEWKIAALPTLQADPSMLRVVLTNLLSNAIKYTRGRNPAHIEVGSHLKNEEHVIFVRDNGAGFDMRYAHKLFGVFQRLHHEDEFEGTGIGLANVQRIISRHGGRVWAEGQLKEGATFYFSLPNCVDKTQHEL
jgi:PAS domain S-box-containing protein